MVKFYLDKDRISSLREKTKLQNYLSSLLSSRMYVKASKTEMVLYIGSNQGAYKISLKVCDAEDFEPTYFSVDVAKWMNTLDKYSFASKISFQLKGTSLVVGEEGSRDTISAYYLILKSIGYKFLKESNNIRIYGGDLSDQSSRQETSC